MMNIYLIFILIAQCTTACVADLYQVNRTRTMCFSDVAEFVCTQNNRMVTWIIVSNTTRNDRQLVLHSFFNSNQPLKTTTIDSTTVRGYLIFGNSSFLESSLTIVASLSVNLRCNGDVLAYRPLNSK